MVRASLLSVSFVVGACGGVIDTGDASVPIPDATSPETEPTVDAQTCSALLSELAGQTANAIQCCPTCNVPQCVVLADGLCCPLSVTSGTSDAVNIYESTLAQIKNAHCAVTCPNMPCLQMASTTCQQNGACAQQ